MSLRVFKVRKQLSRHASPAIHTAQSKLTSLDLYFFTCKWGITMPGWKNVGISNGIVDKCKKWYTCLGAPSTGLAALWAPASRTTVSIRILHGSWLRASSPGLCWFLSLLMTDLTYQPRSSFSQTLPHTRPCWEPLVASAPADPGMHWSHGHLFAMPCHWQSDPKTQTTLSVLTSLTQSVKIQASLFSDKPSLSRGPNETGKSSLDVQNDFSGMERISLWDLEITMSINVKSSPNSTQLLCYLTAIKTAVFYCQLLK